MTTKSVMVPTPGIEECRNYVIVQRLIQERIRSTILKEPFVDLAAMLVSRFIEVPPALVKQDEIERFIKSEAKEVMAVFHKYEENPAYAEAIMLMKDISLCTFNIVSVTFTGMLVLIETE